MNQVIKIIVIILFISVNIYSQTNTNNDSRAEVYFTSGFQGETFDIKISNVLIDSQKALITIPNLGITAYYLSFFDNDDTTLKVMKRDKTFVLLNSKKRYKIKIIDFEKKSFVFKFNIRKGKYLLISKDKSGTIQFTQRSVEPDFY